MRVAIVGGTHPRHLFFHSTISNVVGKLLVARENMTPEPPRHLGGHDKALWIRHFDNRAICEQKYFGNNAPVSAMVISPSELNTAKSRDYIAGLKPDVVLVFGCGLLKWYLDVPMINLHLGLSPRYRGSATLFWPFYLLEPNNAGCTFHQIVDEPDAGKILHQVRPKMMRGDTIHDVSCRAVLAAQRDFSKLQDKFPDWEYHKQKNTGKCFLSGDFQPHHLRNIYDVWDDDIAGAYLRGDIKPHEQWIYSNEKG